MISRVKCVASMYRGRFVKSGHDVAVKVMQLDEDTQKIENEVSSLYKVIVIVIKKNYSR